MIESLERRQLFAAPTLGTIDLTDGVLTITGTDHTDIISISIRETESGKKVLSAGIGSVGRIMGRKEVRQIVIRAGGGDDVINIYETNYKGGAGIPELPLPPLVFLGRIDVPAFIDSGDGDDRIISGGGNDTILGGPGGDLVYAGSGQDRVLGGDHRDLIYGERGNDTLLGGAANDGLYGGRGDDLLDGGGGRHDIVRGSFGADTLFEGGTHGLGAVTLTGQLRDDFGAIGGETTGWYLMPAGSREDLLQLDFGKLKSQAARYAGQNVTVIGRIVEYSYVESGKVRTLVVESIRPA